MAAKEGREREDFPANLLSYPDVLNLFEYLNINVVLNKS